MDSTADLGSTSIIFCLQAVRFNAGRTLAGRVNHGTHLEQLALRLTQWKHRISGRLAWGWDACGADLCVQQGDANSRRCCILRHVVREGGLLRSGSDVKVVIAGVTVGAVIGAHYLAR